MAVDHTDQLLSPYRKALTDSAKSWEVHMVWLEEFSVDRNSVTEASTGLNSQDVLLLPSTRSVTGFVSVDHRKQGFIDVSVGLVSTTFRHAINLNLNANYHHSIIIIQI